MISAAASEPASRQCSRAWPRQRAARKPAANRSPAPVVSTTLATGAAGTSTRSPSFDRQRARGAARNDQRRNFGESLASAAEIARAGQLHCLVLIGEQDVDHRRSSIIPITPSLAAGDAQAFRQSEGDRPARRVGDLGGPQHRRARPLGAPQIAFEEGDRGRADQLPRRALGRELVARPGAGVHRPLGVGRDEDQAAAGRRPAGQRRRVELDSERRMSCAKMSPNWSSAIWPMKPASTPEGGDPGHAVRRRAAADLARRAHRRIETRRPRRCRAPHRALGKAALVEERIVAGRDHVDDRVADRHDVEAWGSHGCAR